MTCKVSIGGNLSGTRLHTGARVTRGPARTRKGTGAGRRGVLTIGLVWTDTENWNWAVLHWGKHTITLVERR
jgi:hypothetical protein